MRRVSAVSGAVGTVDSEMICLIVFCLGCVRCGGDATYEPALSKHIVLQVV